MSDDFTKYLNPIYSFESLLKHRDLLNHLMGTDSIYRFGFDTDFIKYMTETKELLTRIYFEIDAFDMLAPTGENSDEKTIIINSKYVNLLFKIKHIYEIILVNHDLDLTMNVRLITEINNLEQVYCLDLNGLKYTDKVIDIRHLELINIFDPHQTNFHSYFYEFNNSKDMVESYYLSNIYMCEILKTIHFLLINTDIKLSGLVTEHPRTISENIRQILDEFLTY